MSKSQSTKAGFALLLATLPLSCKLDPKAPELEYELNASAVEANEALADDPEVLRPNIGVRDRAPVTRRPPATDATPARA